MSVDFPAPFSPRRACTSPRRTSRSMRSFATSAPKRLVTPFSSRASGVLCSVRVSGPFGGSRCPWADAGGAWQGRRPAGILPGFQGPRTPPGADRRSIQGYRDPPKGPLLLDLGRDVRDLARLDLRLDLVDLVDVLLALGVDLAVADAARGDVEHVVRAGLEVARLDLLDRREHGLVDLLERRGHDLITQVALIGVDADALHALLLGRVERAEAAAAGHLEDDLGALGDLVEGDLLALR